MGNALKNQTLRRPAEVEVKSRLPKNFDTLRKHQFKKGQSGNPNGVRQTANLSKLCRTYTEEAVDTLVTILRHGKTPPATRVTAARELLDRGWGKPQSSVHVTTGDAASLSTTELEAVIREGEQAALAAPPAREMVDKDAMEPAKVIASRSVDKKVTQRVEAKVSVDSDTGLPDL